MFRYVHRCISYCIMYTAIYIYMIYFMNNMICDVLQLLEILDVVGSCKVHGHIGEPCSPEGHIVFNT